MGMVSSLFLVHEDVLLAHAVRIGSVSTRGQIINACNNVANNSCNEHHFHLVFELRLSTFVKGRKLV